MHPLAMLGPAMRDMSVDLHTDIRALIGTWERQGARTHDFNNFALSQSFNMENRMLYIASADNPADQGSRDLDSNVMLDPSGHHLRHFTPHPTRGSAEINVFSQEIQQEFNLYACPPFCLISPLLAYCREKQVKQCTLVVPVKGLV